VFYDDDKSTDQQARKNLHDEEDTEDDDDNEDDNEENDGIDKCMMISMLMSEYDDAVSYMHSQYLSI